MEIITHANLVIGGNPAAVTRTAKQLAQIAVCSSPVHSGAKTAACDSCRDCRKARGGIHPDIITVSKPEDKKEFPVDLVRSMITEAQFLPTEASRKVFILPDAAAMNINAANAFLKLLEEPPEWVTFILMGERLSDFLQTIQSRCNVVRAADGSTPPERTHDSAEAIFAAFASHSASNAAAECMKLEKLKREELQSVLDALYVKFAESAKQDRRYVYAAEQIFEPLKQLRSGLNLGAGHVAGTVMVNLTQLII